MVVAVTAWRWGCPYPGHCLHLGPPSWASSMATSIAHAQNTVFPPLGQRGSGRAQRLCGGWGGRGLRRGKGRRQGNAAGGRGEGREEVEKSREKEGKGRRDEELGKKERRGERSRRGIEAGSGLPRAWQCSAHSPGWVNVCKTNQTELCPQRTQGTQPRSFRRGSSFRARCRQECPPSCWLMPITPQAAH